LKFFDFNDPFFRPLWLRIAVVVMAGGWAMFEFSHGETFWGTLFVGIAAIAVWGLFITFDPRQPGDRPKD